MFLCEARTSGPQQRPKCRSARGTYSTPHAAAFGSRGAGPARLTLCDARNLGRSSGPSAARLAAPTRDHATAFVWFALRRLGQPLSEEQYESGKLLDEEGRARGGGGVAGLFRLRGARLEQFARDGGVPGSGKAAAGLIEAIGGQLGLV